MRELDWGLIANIIAAAGTMLTALAGVVAGLFVVRSQRRLDSEEKQATGGSVGTSVWLPSHGNYVPYVWNIANPAGATEAAEQGPDNQTTLLEKYHAQGLGQSAISFGFSIIFAGLGFIIIGVGAFTAFTAEASWTKGALPIVSGTVIDGVAGLIFVQSNRARENMTAFFDRLRADTKLAEALKLASQIDDKKVAANLKAYLAMHFAGVDVGLNAYRSVVGLPASLKEDTLKDPEAETTPSSRGKAPARPG